MSPLHTYAFRVRFQDVDASGVMSVPTLLTHVHDAYMELLDSAGLPLPKVLAEGEFILPLVRVEADVLGPLRHGESLRVEVRCSESSARSFTLEHTVSAKETGATVATCRTVHVAVDPKTGRARPLPSALVDALGIVRA